MIRACIHLGMYNHLVSDGICKKILDTISSHIAHEVSKTMTAKNFAIALVPSNEFLDGFLFIYSGLGPKEMFWGKELEDVMDKFEILSLSNIRNMISLFR